MERAVAALERLSEITRASGIDWALGIEARAQALLSDGDAAERLYREAIERLGRTHVRVELGRAHPAGAPQEADAALPTQTMPGGPESLPGVTARGFD